MLRSHLSHPKLHVEMEQIGLLHASNRAPLHQDEAKLPLFDADKGSTPPLMPRAVSPAATRDGNGENAVAGHKNEITLAKIGADPVEGKQNFIRPDAHSLETGLKETPNRAKGIEFPKLALPASDCAPPSKEAPEARCRGKNWPLPTPTQFKLSASVARDIERSVGALPAETGGMLGGDRRNFIVKYFHFDKTARSSGATYSPDTGTLNRLLANEWDPKNIEVLGFVHSHPPGMIRPSEGDFIYAARILAALPNLPYLSIPIVEPKNGKRKARIHAYAVSRAGDTFNGHNAGVLVAAHGVRLHTLRTCVVPEEMEPTAKPPKAKDTKPSEPAPLSFLLWLVCATMILIEFRAARRAQTPVPPGQFEHFPEPQISKGGRIMQPAFERVEGAYDLDRLEKTRVVSLGTGGAAAFLEDLARAGVGEQVIIDPDSVSITNIATQQVYRSDLGRPKVEVVAHRLKGVNPWALVVHRQRCLNDISDAEMERFLFAPASELDRASRRSEPPIQTLLCGLTDNFEAQARINRLALQFGVPSLCAQVYGEGRGAEITFTVPGITPACHRCALASRYSAYLKEGFQNDVTSHGTPIFATTRLNALKGFITMAILHHGTPHPRWGGLIERIGERNLVMLRLDPDIGQTLGLPVFDRVFGASTENSVLFDEAIWRPQKPDNPANGYPRCPDCGGTGDLRDAIGSFASTLPMRS